MLHFNRFMSAAAIAAALAVAAPASADVLYNNGAPSYATIGRNIFSFDVSDSFALANASTVTDAVVALWWSGDGPTSLDWGISNTPEDYSVDGSASLTQITPTGTDTAGFNLHVAEFTFSLGDVHLGAGTWYLALQNAGPGFVYWDQNGGASTATQSTVGSIPSESFRILGTEGSGAPEPATWAMMIMGFAGLGTSLRAGRRKAFTSS